MMTAKPNHSSWRRVGYFTMLATSAAGLAASVMWGLLQVGLLFPADSAFGYAMRLCIAAIVFGVTASSLWFIGFGPAFNIAGWLTKNDSGAMDAWRK